jgi:hypothetical protein
MLTDNPPQREVEGSIQFAEQPRNRNTAWSRHIRFDMISEPNGIEHRLTKPNHPWTNGQVERMNRTIKEATVKRFDYESEEQLRTHLADFMAAYNFTCRLNTLSDLTHYKYIAKIWTSEPDRFIVDPIHQMPEIKKLDCDNRMRAFPQVLNQRRQLIELVESYSSCKKPLTHCFYQSVSIPLVMCLLNSM